MLTDVHMPVADGFTLAETITSDPATAGTGPDYFGRPAGDAARCRDLGVAATTKPIAIDLRSAICWRWAFSLTRNRPALVTRHPVEARRTGRILLVEDNGVNQLIARRVLEKQGHTVVVANNGREALTILDEAAFGGFDCVLMDVQMPEMDGFECTAFIRAKEPAGSRLPIVAMTAHAMKGDEARCLEAGMDAYLSKPIHRDELFDVVERYLGVTKAGVF